MKITVEFIDHAGFWWQRIGKSKKIVLLWIKTLHPDTCIQWLGSNHVHVSQQYIRKDKL